MHTGRQLFEPDLSQSEASKAQYRCPPPACCDLGPTKRLIKATLRESPSVARHRVECGYTNIETNLKKAGA